MKVRNINPIALAMAQTAWLETEYNARAAFAILRLDALDALAPSLTDADLFDAAYGIWDDYIDGRRADERFEPVGTWRLTEQASIFARLVGYLTPKEVFALAVAAWGDDSFEVYVCTSASRIVGKLGWYHGQTFNLRTLGGGLEGVWNPGSDLTIWRDRGRKIKAERRVRRPEQTIALHPVFGRA